MIAKRSKWLAILIIALLLIILYLSSTSTPTRTRIVILGPDDATLRELIKEFNRRNPDIEAVLEPQTTDESPTITQKLTDFYNWLSEKFKAIFDRLFPKTN